MSIENPKPKSTTTRAAKPKTTTTRKPRTTTPRKSVKKKTQRVWPNWLKISLLVLTLILLSPLYYGYILNGFVSTWRWIKDYDQDPNYRTYESFNIKIPKKHKIHGIDVSYYQGKIDWEMVKSMEEDSVRIHFAFIKATEGLTLVDPYFKRNWREAPKAGIIVGAYHFFRPKVDGLDQAKFFTQVVHMDKGDLRPVVDIETLDGVPANKMRAELAKFLKHVEKKTRVKPIIYTGLKFYQDHFDGYFEDYPFWIAHYYQAELKLEDHKYHFWQHSDKAKINGINHVVDFNAFNGDSTQFEKMRLQR